MSTRFQRCYHAIQNFFYSIFHTYCDIMIFHPIKVLIIVLSISLAISAASFYFKYTIIDFDPVKGFETRGTELSEQRLILEKLEDALSSQKQILISELGIPIRKRDASSHSSKTSTTLEPITVDYDEYGTDSEPNIKDFKNDPCTQYEGMESSHLYDYVYLLSKVIIEVPRNKLFTLKTFKAICEVDNILNSTVERLKMNSIRASDFHFSFNLGLASLCLNVNKTKKCENIEQADVDHLKETIKKCQIRPSEEICKFEVMQQVLQFLLPKNEYEPYIAVILPVQISQNEEMAQFYDSLQKALQEHFWDNELEIVGLYFQTKELQFGKALWHDGVISSISALLVLTCFFAYSRSIFFTVMILIIIILSMGLSFFFYSIVLGIEFFPFINLLVLVLMASVGADDAFLLLSYYRTERQKLTGPWQPGDTYLPATCLLPRCIRISLEHSLISMFITSATTAVAFMSNFFSDVIVLRCFGIYACLTVLMNYCLVVFILPSCIVLTSSERSYCRFKFLPRIAHFTKSYFQAILITSIFLTIYSFYVIIFTPGLDVPPYNPTKLLRSSNPQEWFDDNSHLFNFEWKRKLRFMEYYTYSKFEIRDAGSLSPYNKGYLLDPPINLNYENLLFLKNLTAKANLQEEKPNWIDIFLDANHSCIYDDPIEDSCFKSFYTERLPSKFPDDLAFNPSDGPLFDKNSNLVGYFVAVPSSEVLSLAADNVKTAFARIRDVCSEFPDTPMLKCGSISEIDRYFDIIDRLRSSTFYNVLLSIGVSFLVVVCSTRRFVLSCATVLVITVVILWTTATLVLFGWQLTVVESTIIILTIGLSFDFSLHIASSLRDEDEKLFPRIENSLGTAGVACFLAAIAGILCGIPLLFAKTAAFFQVGMMLIVLGIFSFIGAVLLLPAVLMIMDNCRDHDVIKM